MSIHTPPADWFRAPHGAERTWVGIAIAWCIVMTIAMPYWHIYGKQNNPSGGFRVEPAAYAQRVAQSPGGDAYLQAQMWLWFPILKLKKGQTYRLHLSSLDLQHGFSIQPLNMNFQVVPGYDHVLTLTPTSAGEFSIVCNEFCGIGHHLMTGRIIVEE
jgi:cytochrome c oxidase subunit 2